MTKPRSKQLVVCFDNDGYPASLEKRKIYVALRDVEGDAGDRQRSGDEEHDEYRHERC